MKSDLAADEVRIAVEVIKEGDFLRASDQVEKLMSVLAREFHPYIIVMALRKVMHRRASDVMTESIYREDTEWAISFMKDTIKDLSVTLGMMENSWAKVQAMEANFEAGGNGDPYN